MHVCTNLAGCTTRPKKRAEKIAEPTVCVGLNSETSTGPFFSSTHVWYMMDTELTRLPCYVVTMYYVNLSLSSRMVAHFTQVLASTHHKHKGEDYSGADLGRPRAEPPCGKHLEHP